MSFTALIKMIGVVSERGRCRISAAVSKPSIPGMFTSSRMTAKSCLSRQRNASLPERRADQILVQVCQDRLVGEQLVGAVVDDQDIDLLVGSSGPVGLDSDSASNDGASYAEA